MISVTRHALVSQVDTALRQINVAPIEKIGNTKVPLMCGWGAKDTERINARISVARILSASRERFYSAADA